MITYLYWTAVVILVFAALLLVGVELEIWKLALPLAGAVLIAGWAAYYFHFQQVFVKRWAA